MSNRRAIGILLMLIALLVGANLWVDLSTTEAPEMLRCRPLLPSSDKATAFEITDAAGKVCRLEKTDHRWRLVQPFTAVADQSAVARLIDTLAFVPSVETTELADALKLNHTLADFGLEPPRLTLKAFSPSGEDTVAFGHKVQSEDSVYASVNELPLVHVVPSEIFDAANRSLDAWRRRTVFQAVRDELQSIDLRRGETAAVRLEKRGERWEVVAPRRAPAVAAAVNRIVDTVLSCEAKKFVWPTGATNETANASVALLAGYGLDSETCETVVFHTVDGRDHMISFGASADADSVYALVQGGTAIATVTAAAKESVSVDASVLIDGRLFPIEKSAVQRISVVDGEVSYLLARGEDGRWRLDSPVTAAADENAVSQLIDRLLVLRTADLDEHGVKVSLALDAPAVAVAKTSFLGEGGFEQLRSKVVLDIEPAAVKRIVMAKTGEEKAESVVYDPDRKGWNVEATGKSGTIDQERLAAVLATLSPLRAKSVARIRVTSEELAKFGLENPSCTLAIDRRLENSVRRNILFGKRLNDRGDTYATVGTSDAVFVLDGATVKVLTAGVLSE